MGLEDGVAVGHVVGTTVGMAVGLCITSHVLEVRPQLHEPVSLGVPTYRAWRHSRACTAINQVTNQHELNATVTIDRAPCALSDTGTYQWVLQWAAQWASESGPCWGLESAGWSGPETLV